MRVKYKLKKKMKKNKFKRSIEGAEKYYESIELYEDRMALQNEFELAFNPEDIKYDREFKFYKWLRDNKL